MATGAELTYNTNATAMQMANAIFGDGVTVKAASYSGAATSKAIYSNGQLSPGVLPSDTGVILSTGRAADFTQSSGDPNRGPGTTTDTTGANNNAQLNALAGTSTFDASILDVDFVPTGDTMTLRFVFSSEEYPEFVGSQFNDMMGVWVNGGIVPIAVGSGQVGVTNINQTNQPNLSVDNSTDAFNTEMDGFTITLTLKMTVIPGVVNSIRFAIADTSDALYDSNLLIAGDSAQTVLVAQNDAITMPATGSRTLDVLANDRHPAGSTLTITQINGVNVVAGQVVTLPSGQQIRLNADGTFTVLGDGQAETVHFTYTVKDGLGHIDTGIVTVNSVPCFVAGTRILTPGGEVRVEDLSPGDLVCTLDDGPQPLRWTGCRAVEARGDLAPVRIPAGTFGNHGALSLSPQHRVLLSCRQAELLFGEAEVLVAAKDLVDGHHVTRQVGGIVVYVHLLFDRHQVILSEGLPTESFLPGRMGLNAFEQAVQDEILLLFPALDPETGAGYGPAARRSLRGFEAQVLLAEGVAA